MYFRFLLFFISFFDLSFANYETQVGSVSWGYQSISIVVTGSDCQIWFTQYDGSVWLPWETFGGCALSGPAICSWGWGRLDVYHVGNSDGEAWWRKYDYYKAGPQWNGWAPTSPASCLYSGVICTAPGMGKINVFGIGHNYQLWGQNNTDLSTFYQFGNFNGQLSTNPPGAVWILNTIYVFARGNDSNLYYITSTGNMWSTWNQINLEVYSGPAIIFL